MKKLAVVLIGWHYPIYTYKKLITLPKPDLWDIDFFIVGHRDPIYSYEEKVIHGNDLLSKLDNLLYKDKMSINDLKILGWTYIPSKSGNEWEGANVFLSIYDYKNYDCILFAGDDFLIIDDNLFLDVLNSECKLFSNKKIDDVWIASEDIIKYDDWLVISNSVHPGRQAIRGSFEFFKPELFDVLKGKFPIHESIVELSKHLENNISTPKDSLTALQAYNKQFIPFMDIINQNDIYDKIKFLSGNYRISDYIIECERGLLVNSHVYTNSYTSKLQQLKNKLNSLI